MYKPTTLDEFMRLQQQAKGGTHQERIESMIVDGLVDPADAESFLLFSNQMDALHRDLAANRARKASADATE